MLIRNISFQMEDRLLAVRFRQEYRADDYRDKGEKTLYLEQEKGKWLIRKETWRAVD